MKFQRPFMLRSTHESIRRENYTLRDALRNANAELVKHRKLLVGIKSGYYDVVTTLDRMEQT